MLELWLTRLGEFYHRKSLLTFLQLPISQDSVPFHCKVFRQHKYNAPFKSTGLINDHGFTTCHKMQKFDACSKVVKDVQVAITSQPNKSSLAGFMNYKDAFKKFEKHKWCNFLKHCVEVLLTIYDIEETLDRQAAMKKQANKGCLLKVLSTVSCSIDPGMRLLKH